jgi:hypothetical protein
MFVSLFFLNEEEVEKWILKRDRIGWDGVDWIDTAQDRDQWRALVNTVMNFRVP